MRYCRASTFACGQIVPFTLVNGPKGDGVYSIPWDGTDGDGRDVCREVRRRRDVPVIMITARGTETDRIVSILKELNRETGLTILLIEHVMRAVMALASRILVLHHGAAIAEGTPDEIVRNPAVIHSYLGAEAVA